MLNAEAVVFRLRTFVKAVSFNITPLPAEKVTSAPRYCQLVVTPMSQGVPFVPVQVRDAMSETSKPTILLAVSLVRMAVTPGGSAASVKAPKPEPPIEPLYLINGTSPSAGTPVITLIVTVPEVVRLVAVMTALALLRLASSSVVAPPVPSVKLDAGKVVPPDRETASVVALFTVIALPFCCAAVRDSLPPLTTVLPL